MFPSPNILGRLIVEQELRSEGHKVNDLILFLHSLLILLKDEHEDAAHLDVQLPMQDIHGGADYTKRAKLLENREREREQTA